jgi:hypothetical protein
MAVTNMKKIGSLLISFSIIVTSPVTALEIVYVSAPSCSNVYSDFCGWGDFFEPGGGGGYYPIDLSGGGGGGTTGGTSGGTTSTDQYPIGNGIYDDGTTGTSNNFNRFNPGCAREAQFMNQIFAAASMGTPEGRVIIQNPSDKLYNNGEWVKMQSDRIYREINSDSSIGLRWRTTAHFMYNTVTHEVDQLKLKTSFELGCKGIPYTS